MATVDFTLDDLKQVFATKEEFQGLEDRLGGKIDAVKEMLEDDYKAESKRLDGVDRRVTKLRRDFNRHLDVASS